MQFNEKIVINAPVEKVFAAYENVSGWSEWDPDVVSSHLDGAFEVGTFGKLKPKGGPTTKIQVTSVSKNESFTVECKMPLCKMEFIHELTESAEHSTEVVNKIIFTGPLGPVFGRMIGKGIAETMPGSLKGLKQHLE